MEYSEVIKVIPAILSTVKLVIDIYKTNPKNIYKKMKGTGFNKKMSKIEDMLTNLQYYKDTLLFYSRILPDTASMYTIADKLTEMIQGSSNDLDNDNSPNYDTAWGIISMMFNSVKAHKNNHIVSKIDACPYSPDSEEIKEINKLIRDLENEFERANAYLVSRKVANFLDQNFRISQLSYDLKTTIMKHTERLINSISTEIETPQ